MNSKGLEFSQLIVAKIIRNVISPDFLYLRRDRMRKRQIE
jgi:hypothetical protein